jgi:hypothetical protein
VIEIFDFSVLGFGPSSGKDAADEGGPFEPDPSDRPNVPGYENVCPGHEGVRTGRSETPTSAFPGSVPNSRRTAVSFHS